MNRLDRLDFIRERAHKEVKVTDEELKTWHESVLQPFPGKLARYVRCPWVAEAVEPRMNSLNLPFFAIEGNWASIARTYTDLLAHETER